jgi:hypothetical protein
MNFSYSNVTSDLKKKTTRCMHGNKHTDWSNRSWVISSDKMVAQPDSGNVASYRTGVYHVEARTS